MSIYNGENQVGTQQDGTKLTLLVKQSRHVKDYRVNAYEAGDTTMIQNHSTTSQNNMEPQPYVTLIGPDKHGVISRLDYATKTRDPIIAAHINTNSKPQVHLARILPNNLQQPFGTASYSSLSGSLRVNIQGLPEVKMQQSWEGLQYAKVFKALPEIGGNGGKLRWKPAGWGEATELWDDQGVKLAKFKHRSLKNDPQLNVYIWVSDALVDVMLLGSLGLMVEDTKSTAFMGELVGAIAG